MSALAKAVGLFHAGGARGRPAREVLENPSAENFILFQVHDLHISLLCFENVYRADPHHADILLPRWCMLHKVSDLHFHPKHAA